MATQADYTTAANKAAAILRADIISWVPGFEQGAVLARVPALAGQLAKGMIDAVDAERAKP